MESAKILDHGLFVDPKKRDKVVRTGLIGFTAPQTKSYFKNVQGNLSSEND